MDNMIFYKGNITLEYYVTGYSGLFLNVIICKIDEYNVYMSYTLRVRKYNKKNNLLNVNPKGGNLTFASAAKGSDSQLWYQASDVEIYRLMNSKTIKAIHKEEQPHNRLCDTTYYTPQVKEKLDAAGEKTRKVRGTLGGDKIPYTGLTLAEVADPITVSIHQQSVLADRRNDLNARYVTLDLTDYYLGCQLDREEYPTKHMSPKTLDEFHLHKYITNEKILFNVRSLRCWSDRSDRPQSSRLIPWLL